MIGLRYVALWLVAGAAAAVALPLIAGSSGYLQYMVEIIAIYVLVSAGLNIAIGFAGQYQMAQGCVMACSAYGLAVLHLDLGWPLLAAIAGSLVVALAVGSLVAVLSSRLSSHYLLLATFGLQIVVIGIIRQLDGLTGGANGRAAVTEFDIFGSSLTGSTPAYSALVVAIAMLGLFFSQWLKQSYLGLGLAATRQSERVAQAAGLRVRWFKFFAVLVGTAFAAVGGILIGPVNTYLEVGSFGIEMTLILLIMVVLGGAGSVPGVAFAAVLLTVASQIAQGATTAWPLIYGLFVMVLLTLTNRGLAGLWKEWSAKSVGRSGKAVAADGEGSIPTQPAEAPPPAGDGSAILSLEGVRRTFGGVVAVDSVSFEVETGTIHGLVGPNGSGKTTVFETMSGFFLPVAGSISFKGTDITRRVPADRAGLGLGRSFQHASVLPESTVLENVLLSEVAPMSLSGRLRRIDLASGGTSKAMEALSVVGLSHMRDREAATLAYGQRKLLDLARVIVSRPALALLDEPLAGVDAVSVGYVRQAITFLKRIGCTVVLVEHNMRFVTSLCDRMTVLNAGRTLLTGTPHEVTNDPDVVRSYLGERRGKRSDWRRRRDVSQTPRPSATESA